MAKNIGLYTTGANQDSYLYIETPAGESYSIGADNLTANLCINSSATAGILPDEATSNITINPSANGDIDLFPNGTGKTAILKGNLELTLGTSVYKTFTEGALITSSTGVTSTVTGTAGKVLTANAAGTAPSFQLLPGSSCIFSAWQTPISNVTGDGTAYQLICDNIIFNNGSNYNNTTGVFTAPVTGKYLFILSVELNGVTAAFTNAFLLIVTTARNYLGYNINPSVLAAPNTQPSMEMTAIADMTAGDTMHGTVTVNGGTKVVGIVGNTSTDVRTFIQGYLIG